MVQSSRNKWKTIKNSSFFVTSFFRSLASSWRDCRGQVNTLRGRALRVTLNSLGVRLGTPGDGPDRPRKELMKTWRVQDHAFHIVDSGWPSKLNCSKFDNSFALSLRYVVRHNLKYRFPVRTSWYDGTELEKQMKNYQKFIIFCHLIFPEPS